MLIECLFFSGSICSSGRSVPERGERAGAGGAHSVRRGERQPWDSGKERGRACGAAGAGSTATRSSRGLTCEQAGRQNRAALLQKQARLQ